MFRGKASDNGGRRCGLHSVELVSEFRLRGGFYGRYRGALIFAYGGAFGVLENTRSWGNW